jgi:SAM-dependent methyltransferase
MTADEQRRESVQHWEGAATGWQRREAWMREYSAPVSHWLLDALELQPGHRVLELAAGVGETGFLAAELIAPGGTLICSDQAEAMLEAARARAKQLGLENVEFKAIDAEWIDLPVASVDAVICRWGYMLMADPAAALRETRRVLRPGGRLALAVWDSVELNPWASVPFRAHVANGLLEPTPPGTPGPFALGDRERLRTLLYDTGFAEPLIDVIELEQRQPDFETWWQVHRDLSSTSRRALDEAAPADAEAVKRSVAESFAPFTAPDGEIAVPGRTLVATASA